MLAWRCSSGSSIGTETSPLQLSSGRIGSSQDNAVAESFWATLKRELVSRCRFATRAEVHRAIIGWINHHNVTRLHSSISNLPPIEWELRYAHRDLLAA